MDNFDGLKKQQYLNLETFRKNGESMKTPVWFVQDGGSVFVRTAFNSGKVKRIHNNGQVNVAACKMDGALLGEWMPASAREMDDEATIQRVTDLMDQKYGLMKKIFDLPSRLQGRKYTYLELKAREN